MLLLLLSSLCALRQSLWLGLWLCRPALGHPHHPWLWLWWLLLLR